MEDKSKRAFKVGDSIFVEGDPYPFRNGPGVICKIRKESGYYGVIFAHNNAKWGIHEKHITLIRRIGMTSEELKAAKKATDECIEHWIDVSNNIARGKPYKVGYHFCALCCLVEHDNKKNCDTKCPLPLSGQGQCLPGPSPWALFCQTSSVSNAAAMVEALVETKKWLDEQSPEEESDGVQEFIDGYDWGSKIRATYHRDERVVTVPIQHHLHDAAVTAWSFCMALKQVSDNWCFDSGHSLAESDVWVMRYLGNDDPTIKGSSKCK